MLIVWKQAQRWISEISVITNTACFKLILIRPFVYWNFELLSKQFGKSFEYLQAFKVGFDLSFFTPYLSDGQAVQGFFPNDITGKSLRDPTSKLQSWTSKSFGLKSLNLAAVWVNSLFCVSWRRRYSLHFKCQQLRNVGRVKLHWVVF